MPHRIITVVLLIGLCFALATFAAGVSSWRRPDIEQGYTPAQPIDFSHRLHAGELQLDCRFCHSAAATSRHAGIPASDVCMQCHRIVTSSYDALQEESRQAEAEGRKPQQVISAELRKLYDSRGLDDRLQLKPDATPTSIRWTRVHDLPDFVCFNHSAHLSAGIICQHCHGPVESMQRVRQIESLSMGWCVNCHRDATERGVNGQAVNASVNCTVCHH